MKEQVAVLLTSVLEDSNFILKKGRTRSSEREGSKIPRKRVNQEKVFKKGGKKSSIESLWRLFKNTILDAQMVRIPLSKEKVERGE